jgi:hypothetical protein
MNRINATTEFSNRKNQFFKKLKLNDEEFAAELQAAGSASLTDCFEFVFAHNSFGLPCFRLKVKPNKALPSKALLIARTLFKTCMGSYAL